MKAGAAHDLLQTLQARFDKHMHRHPGIAWSALQAVGEFDLKTSSWIRTPPGIRALGGPLFCDRRYGQVFTYHNGAQSYYAARGFRGALEL